MAQAHWDRVYRSSPVERLGWHEADPAPSLSMVARCGLDPDDLVLDVGSGASAFTARLLDLGHRRLVATDLSPEALDRLAERLGDRAHLVERIVDDVTRPTRLRALRDVALWHDRAVLHFLVDEADRRAYVQTLRTVLRPDGWVILACFSLTGATHCSGLPVRRTDAAGMAELLGPRFALVEAFDHVFTNPRGEPRPYVYARFRRGLGER
jgi:EEF1A lysine methyltransferase 2